VPEPTHPSSAAERAIRSVHQQHTAVLDAERAQIRNQ
jgi:hypothetical protein